jgi:hypothetical protein
VGDDVVVFQAGVQGDWVPALVIRRNRSARVQR